MIILYVLFYCLLSYNGFFLVFDSIPPRQALVFAPSVIAMVLIFGFRQTRNFIKNIELRYLVAFNIVRVPVEFALHELFLESKVPQMMTFEGRNFDIITGLFSIVIYYLLTYRPQLVTTKLLWGYNILGLILLINIVSTALLSVPGPFQVLNYDMPNVGVFYFPYILLPSLIVPTALFTHIVLFFKPLTK